jgi:hypothetical protein
MPKIKLKTMTEYVDHLIEAHWVRPRDKSTWQYLRLRQQLIDAMREWIRAEAQREEMEALDSPIVDQWQIDAGWRRFTDAEIFDQQRRCRNHLRHLLPDGNDIPVLPLETAPAPAEKPRRALGKGRK